MTNQEWYENPDNFPALISANKGMLAVVHYYAKDNRGRPAVYDVRDSMYYIDETSNWKLATMQQHQSLNYTKS